jgi:hypothetical protein
MTEILRSSIAAKNYSSLTSKRARSLNPKLQIDAHLLATETEV